LTAPKTAPLLGAGGCMAALLLPAIVYAATLPSATLANQAVALGGWGVLALSLVGSRRIVGLQGTRA
jgi:hypothetical protein